MSLLDHPAISSRYFFPRPDAPRTPWVVDGLQCARRDKDRNAALLHFHGNGEVVGDWLGDFARAVQGGDVDAFFGEYRGYGGSTGKPSLSALLADALTVFDAIAKERPADQIVVYGRSIGSLAAAHIAANRNVRGLVLESGICDLYERLAVRVKAEEVGATDAELRAAVKESFDQEAKIARSTCPVLVLHAENDNMVKKHHAERNAAAAGTRARLVIYPKGDHNTIHAFNGGDILAKTLALATTAAHPAA